MPTGLALMCAALVWWLYGKEVIRRRTFVWPVYTRYEGQPAVRFGYGMRAAGIAFGLLGLWVLAIWVMER